MLISAVQQERGPRNSTIRRALQLCSPTPIKVASTLKNSPPVEVPCSSPAATVSSTTHPVTPPDHKFPSLPNLPHFPTSTQFPYSPLSPFSLYSSLSHLSFPFFQHRTDPYIRNPMPGLPLFPRPLFLHEASFGLQNPTSNLLRPPVVRIAYPNCHFSLSNQLWARYVVLNLSPLIVFCSISAVPFTVQRK